MLVRVQELNTKPISLQRGIRQEVYNHHRFTDCIVVMVNSLEELSTMLQDFSNLPKGGS